MSPLPRYAALTALPDGYYVVDRLTLQNPRTLLRLNAWGIALLIAGYVGLAAYRGVLQMAGISGQDPFSGATGWGTLALILLGLFVMLSVHELIHGLAFQGFGAKPHYGFSLKKGVAYASAKNYYLTRDAYIIVGLAPLFVLTAVFVALMIPFGGNTRELLIIVGAANIGGCVGDLWFWLSCRRQPPTLLVRDYGDGAELYAPVFSSV
jgi:hypothetical protein